MQFICGIYSIVLLTTLARNAAFQGVQLERIVERR